MSTLAHRGYESASGAHGGDAANRESAENSRKRVYFCRVAAYFGRMDRIFDFLIPATLAAVTLVLFAGLYALFRGGEFGRSYSNKLMRLRVVMQAIAVALLVTAVWWKHRG